MTVIGMMEGNVTSAAAAAAGQRSSMVKNKTEIEEVQ